MSTKVYTAYRLKPAIAKDPVKFWAWVRDTQRRGEVNLKKVLRDVYENLIANVKTDTEDYKSLRERYEYSDRKARLSIAAGVMRSEVRKNATMSERNMFDFDVSIAIREYKGNLYVVPHCDMLCRDVLKFMKRDPRLEDFSYWNNVDPPPKYRWGAGYRKWKARGKVWDEIDKNIREYLLIIVCDYQKFTYVDPWLQMMRENKVRKSEATATDSV